MGVLVVQDSSRTAGGSLTLAPKILQRDYAASDALGSITCRDYHELDI